MLCTHRNFIKDCKTFNLALRGSSLGGRHASFIAGSGQLIWQAHVDPPRRAERPETPRHFQRTVSSGSRVRPHSGGEGI
jgi:hypothetical protein